MADHHLLRKNFKISLHYNGLSPPREQFPTDTRQIHRIPKNIRINVGLSHGRPLHQRFIHTYHSKQARSSSKTKHQISMYLAERFSPTSKTNLRLDCPSSISDQSMLHHDHQNPRSFVNPAMALSQQISKDKLIAISPLMVIKNQILNQQQNLISAQKNQLPTFSTKRASKTIDIDSIRKLKAQLLQSPLTVESRLENKLFHIGLAREGELIVYDTSMAIQSRCSNNFDQKQAQNNTFSSEIQRGVRENKILSRMSSLDRRKVDEGLIKKIRQFSLGNAQQQDRKIKKDKLLTINKQASRNLSKEMGKHLRSSPLEKHRFRTGQEKIQYMRRKLALMKRSILQQQILRKDEKEDLREAGEVGELGLNPRFIYPTESPIRVTFLNVQKLKLMQIEGGGKSKSSCLPIQGRMSKREIKEKGNSRERVEDIEKMEIYKEKKIFRFIPPFHRYFYRDFLWKVAASHGYKLVYPGESTKKFKIYVGPGNNSCLIRTLFKRRKEWWTFTDRIEEADLIWTQLKIPDVFHKQKQQAQAKLKALSGILNSTLIRGNLNSTLIHPVGLPVSISSSSQIDSPLLAPPTSHSSLTENKLKKSLFYDQTARILPPETLDGWEKYMNKWQNMEMKLSEGSLCQKRAKYFTRLAPMRAQGQMHNHLPHNYVIGNKKALFQTMTNFYSKTNRHIFDYLPLTFHIKNGLDDQAYFNFLQAYYDKARKIKLTDSPETVHQSPSHPNREDSPSLQTDQIASFRKDPPSLVRKEQKSIHNIWIVKPGELTNRGNGIIVCPDLSSIKKILRSDDKHHDEYNTPKTYIIQQYLSKPFLYFKRKFDLRHYMLIKIDRGRVFGYWYELGYVRTTSSEFSLNCFESGIHLTNDAVQKHLPDYGKYERGNKVSYEDFAKYAEVQLSRKSNHYRSESPSQENPSPSTSTGQSQDLKKLTFYQKVLPRMRQIAIDSMNASASFLDPDRVGHNFEIWGLDFMIDSTFTPWLIEINSNPCYELSCPLLANIIPQMLENALRICIDPFFPPFAKFSEKMPRFSDNALLTNKFELVFDSGPVSNQQLQQSTEIVFSEENDDAIFEDDGVELDD